MIAVLDHFESDMSQDHVSILPNLVWCIVDAGVDHPATAKAVRLIAENLSAGKELPFASGVMLNQASNKLDLLSV